MWDKIRRVLPLGFGITQSPRLLTSLLETILFTFFHQTLLGVFSNISEVAENFYLVIIFNRDAIATISRCGHLSFLGLVASNQCDCQY